MSTRKTVSFFQYPYPAEPRNWTEEERAYGRGLKRLFDILFSRKLQNVLIADKAVDARTIDDGAIQLHHLREGFGTDLDITENESVTTLETGVSQAQSTADGAVTAAAAAQQTADQGVLDASNAMQAASDAQDTADDAVTAAAAAQSTADGLTDQLMPIGITVIMDTSPAFGTWVEVTNIGLDVSAWRRTA